MDLETIKARKAELEAELKKAQAEIQRLQSVGLQIQGAITLCNEFITKQEQPERTE